MSERSELIRGQRAEVAATLCALMQQTIADHGEEIAVRSADGGTALTWRQYGQRVESVARGLAALGVGPGDTVGLMLTNRPEFHVIDAAVMHLGAIAYSIYNTSAAEQITHMLGNADNSVAVCEPQFLAKLERAAVGTRLSTVILVPPANSPAVGGTATGPDGGSPDGGSFGGTVLSLAELEQGGSAGFDFPAAWRSVKPDDVLTVIYTSGTTGPPKGVELTHANITYVLNESTRVLGETAGGRVISYLPDAHIVNRYTAHYAPMAYRLTTTTLDQPKQLLQTLLEVRPTLFVGVPALWYRIIGLLEGSLAAQTGVKGSLARWAVEVGKGRARAISAGRRRGPLARARVRLADRLVLSKIRAQLGLDQLVTVVTGSAPLDSDALLLLLGLGLPLTEAWGMSESTGVTTLNIPDAVRLGTVGRPLPSTQVRVAEDGELLIRGPGVMRGYRRDAVKTAAAMDADGWLQTGDIGSIDADGYVTIVDRKKELIINTSGKNMSPANIENTVKAVCPLVGAVVAIGDRRPHITALITLDPDVAAALGHELGLSDLSAPALAAAPAVREVVEEGIAKANARLSRVEHIRGWVILPTVWEPGGEELTPTLKLKRAPIAAKYAAEIEQLYRT